jgi:hypothetical protein
MSTSRKMKGHPIASFFLVTITSLVVFNACQKGDTPLVEEEQTVAAQKGKPTNYSSDVLDKWMTMQLRLMRNATGIANHAFSRHFAYAGVAAFESLKPGMNKQTAQWSDKWNGLTGLPGHIPANKFYLPENVNAAMATINKAMFSNANAADKAAIDSLELALKNEFLINQPADLIAYSTQYGKEIALLVFEWSETDGYKNANDPYTIPTGPGLWKPTPPALLNPATPYWGNNRPMVKGSTVNTAAEAPMEYSADAGTPFHDMVKEVYDASFELSDEQKATATFWKDVPGATSPGHWLSILQQIIRQTGTTLEKAALACALTGIGINDALITCFQSKYQYNVLRPITYIREVMGYTTWSSFLGTPAHPEYPSAHSSLSMAASNVIENLFGEIGSFTDHTYDYMGYAPRTYGAIWHIAFEAGVSRFYAGIHYIPSINAGFNQGSKVVNNIFSKQTQTNPLGRLTIK